MLIENGMLACFLPVLNQTQKIPSYDLLLTAMSHKDNFKHDQSWETPVD